MPDQTPENINPPLSPADFAVLGLRFSEARTAVIRKAVRKAIRKIRQNELDPTFDSDQTANMADVAVATYRVLDPRRRLRFWERINLSFGDSFDDEVTDRRRISQWQLPELAAQTPPRQRDANHHLNVSP